MVSLNIYVLLINQQVGAHEEDLILREQIQKLDFFSPFSYSMICQLVYLYTPAKRYNESFKDMSPCRNTEVIQETSNREK